MAFNTEAEAVGLEYWIQWQVFVCALIIILPLIISVNLIIKRKSKREGFEQLKSSDLWLPCWKNLHPKWLLLYRALAFLSMAFLLYQTVDTFGVSVFYFYTQNTESKENNSQKFIRKVAGKVTGVTVLDEADV